jgi:hypothetical protein
MNSLLIFLIIIIIFSILYLYFRNYQHRKILESFSYESSTPITQSSLSTYYQNNVDKDTQKMPYHGIDYKSNLIPQWTGSWISEDKSISCQIVQLNDQLTITFTNNPIEPNDNNDSNECPPNAYIGLGMLNQNKSIFYLISTICDTYDNEVLQPTPGSTSGVLNGRIFTLYQSGRGRNIKFILKDKLSSYGTSYNNVFTATTSFFPTEINTVLEEIDPCPTGTDPCKITYQGIADDSINGLPYNSCATSVNGDGTCGTDPSCVFYNGTGAVTYNSKTIQKCSENYDINGTLGYISTYGLSRLKDSSKSVCNIGRMFGSDSNYNSTILCYITNVGNVATLNYQFFGTLPSESSLTVQYDVMNKILNTDNRRFSLQSVRKEINSFSMPTQSSSTEDKKELINLLSFTNSVYMNNTAGTVETLLSNSLNTTKNIVSSYIATNSNNNLMPAVWQINQSNSSSSSPSCPFTISTSSLYNTPVKYVQYNLDGTTNLSLFGNGDNQTFLMDNLNLIGSNDRFAIATLNIKTATSLYLIPSQDNNGFSNNSNLVNLSISPEINGKWMIIGFNLSNISDLNKMMHSASRSTFYNMITNSIINNS